MCAGKKPTTRTNEREFHITRTCANVRIADTGVEPVISCLGGKRGYPFHSSAIAVCRICTHKPKLKAYYWLQSVPKSIDTQHTSRLKTTSDRSAVIPYYFQHDNLLYPGYCNHWICSYLQQISFYRFYTCRPQPAVIGRNFSHGSRTRYSMDMSRMWLFVPFGWSAVWRIRTSKSFPTDWLATSSNTIMGIRHVMAQFLDTQLTNSTLRLPEGVVPSKWSWWSEIRTHEPKGTDLQSACFVHLHIHQCQRCVFAKLSPLIKQVPWFFMCAPITMLTFGYSLSLPALRKDTELNFTECQRMESNHFLSALLSRASDRSFQWATLT